MLAEKIKEIIEDSGFSYREKSRSIATTCPVCGQSKKFSILKKNGASICFRGSCDFGKRWFEDWIAMTKGIPRTEAKKILLGSSDAIEVISDRKTLSFKDHFNYTPMSEVEPINYPAAGGFVLSNDLSLDGVKYLESRGIPKKLAEYHDITYSPIDRRVVLPIKVFGTCYGYQARAVDNVLDKDRMRNNLGFRRDRMLMFHDEALSFDHLIITEGPFDALKFAKVGGYVATLGKEVSNHQIEIMHELEPTKVFIAFDSDALEESYKLANDLRNVGRSIYLLTTPQSCIDRCKAIGKKYDFGECTFDEAANSLADAKLIYKD